jgi:hypothetical protein
MLKNLKFVFVLSIVSLTLEGNAMNCGWSGCSGSSRVAPYVPYLNESDEDASRDGTSFFTQMMVSVRELSEPEHRYTVVDSDVLDLVKLEHDGNTDSALQFADRLDIGSGPLVFKDRESFDACLGSDLLAANIYALVLGFEADPEIGAELALEYGLVDRVALAYGGDLGPQWRHGGKDSSQKTVWWRLYR